MWLARDHSANNPETHSISSYYIPQETQVRSLGQEDLLEEGMATHSRILAWRIPWAEEPGGLQSMGLQRVWHNWSTLACIYYTAIPNLDVKDSDCYHLKFLTWNIVSK